MKFGTGMRSSMENANAKKVPGPGEHQPDFKQLKNQSPRFGFGTESRNKTEDLKKITPGPGNYSLGTIVGKDGPQKSCH